MRVSTAVCIALALAGCSDAHLNLPPDVHDLALETTEDTAATITIDATDPDRDGLVFELATEPEHGTVELDAAVITYTPVADFHGDDSLTFTVYDTKNPRVTGTVLITVTPVNDAPLGTADTIAASEDTVRTIAATALLQNDTDIDGDTLAISAVANPTHGTVALSGADVVFTPDADFTGEGSFDYTLDDGTVTATVTVTVDIGGANDAPVAVDDVATTAEDTPIDIMNLLANDTDADGQVLTIDSATAVTGGTVSRAGDTVTFTPTADSHGTASFTYVVTDGVATDTGTVTVTVTSVNDAPVAADDTDTIDEDTPKTFTTLTGNDSDVDGDTLTVTDVANANNGTVQLNGGQPIFTPTADFSGAASFEYTVSDGNGGTDTGLVEITVAPINDSPIAADDTATTAEDTPVTLMNLLDNDTDAENDTLSVTAVSNFVNCTVALNGGDPIVTPTANFNGTATFDYTLSDGNGGMDTGSVSVTVTAAPDVSSLTPSTISLLANGGTGILTVTLDSAPTGGDLVVDITVPAFSLYTAPTTVTVPQGATTATFRIQSTAPVATSDQVTASVAGAGSASATINHVTTAPAPVLGDLVINEVLPDPPVTGGDANCDGIRDAEDDEFIELANLSAHPVDLTGVSIWDSVAFGNTTARYSFSAATLGAGEVVIVFGNGAAITNTTDPWCAGAGGTRIGDAQVFYIGNATGLSLTNTGDTVHITATSSVVSTEIVTALVIPSTAAQAYVRDPDFTGAFVKETSMVGATDRVFTPGTLITGFPFASASP